MANSLDAPMSVSIEGLAGLQAENRRLMEATSTQPGGGLRNDLILALLQLQRYALGIVHVKTGRLKNSIFTSTEGRGNTLIGHVATNVSYAAAEDARGGAHAFFGRTIREEGPHINSIFEAGIRRGRK